MEPTNTVINEIYADVQKYLADDDFENALRSAETEQEYNIVYDDFISKRFKDHVTEVKEVEPTFRIELQHLGFKDGKNPFISFVDSFVTRHKMKLDKYNIIHNLYVEGVIQDADLSQKGPLKGNNVIFHDTLYNQDNRSIEYIIRLQDWIINNGGLKNKINNKTILDHYNNFQSGNDRRNFLIDVLYETSDGDVVTLTKDQKFTFHKNYDKEGQLVSERVRKASEIEDIMLAISKQVGEGNIDDDDRQSAKTNWKTAIEDLNINSRNVRDVISTLVVTYVNDPKKAVRLISDYGNPQSGPETTVRWRTSLSRTNINERNVEEVISYLIKKYIPSMNGGAKDDNQSR